MPREFSRTLRVGEQLQREVAVLIQQEIKDPRVGMVTVSAVEVSKDLSHAKVFVTILGNSGDAHDSIKALNHAASYLRRELGHRLALRTVPALHFVYDASVERGARLSSLIEASVKPNDDHGGQ